MLHSTVNGRWQAEGGRTMMVDQDQIRPGSIVTQADPSSYHRVFPNDPHRLSTAVQSSAALAGFVGALAEVAAAVREPLERYAKVEKLI